MKKVAPSSLSTKKGMSCVVFFIELPTTPWPLLLRWEDVGRPEGWPLGRRWWYRGTPDRGRCELLRWCVSRGWHGSWQRRLGRVWRSNVVRVARPWGEDDWSAVHEQCKHWTRTTQCTWCSWRQCDGSVEQTWLKCGPFVYW
jgi:hypothetical protein